MEGKVDLPAKVARHESLLVVPCNPHYRREHRAQLCACAEIGRAAVAYQVVCAHGMPCTTTIDGSRWGAEIGSAAVAYQVVYVHGIPYTTTIDSLRWGAELIGKTMLEALNWRGHVVIMKTFLAFPTFIW